MGAASITTAPALSDPDRLLGQPRARLQRRVAGGVLHGVAGLVGGDDHGRERAPVEVLRGEPHDLGLGIVVIAEIGLLDLDVGELHLIEDVARELAAGAGKIRALAGMPDDDLLHPQLRQHREGEDERQDDNDCGQRRTPRIRRMDPLSPFFSFHAEHGCAMTRGLG